MVENFTTLEEETYTSDLEAAVVAEDNAFETNIRHFIQKIGKAPRQSVIEGLLDYSRLWNNKGE